MPLHSWTYALKYGHGGLVMLTGGLIGVLLLRRSEAARHLARSATTAIMGIALLVVFLEAALTTFYLITPSYQDHIEPTIATIAQYFRQGSAVYPSLDSYTFHGLLYGPLLPELTSLGYAIFRPSLFASKLMGWASGWGAVALMVITSRRTGGGWPAWVALSGTLCIVASFGTVLVWDRADPLLFLFATLALTAVLRFPSKASLVVAAFLAGAAIDLKVHGLLYVAPALCLWAVTHLRASLRVWSQALPIAVIAALTGAILPLLPANVSLQAYLRYLELALIHGLSVDMFLWNATFLVALWLPMVLGVFVADRNAAEVRRTCAILLALLGAEVIVTIIGSKPGAGTHHLLPFLGFHAYFLQKLLLSAGDSTPRADWARSVSTVGLAALTLGMIWPFAINFRELLRFERSFAAHQQAQAELIELSRRYPGGVMGVADTESYPATFVRPWLTFQGTPQVEFGAYMDLKRSGIGDEPLVEAFERCEIPYLYMPAGEPFTLLNGYDQRPLFSDRVREAFGARYWRVETGVVYSVYSCTRTRR